MAITSIHSIVLRFFVFHGFLFFITNNVAHYTKN